MCAYILFTSILFYPLTFYFAYLTKVIVINLRDLQAYPLFIQSGQSMTLDYHRLLKFESATTQQLKYLEQVISNHFDLQQQYPQLFQNQDSLFAPDQVFDHHQEHNNHENYQKISHNIKNFHQMQHSGSQGQQIFEHYLDSLDINQFLDRKGQCLRGQKIRCSKSSKNLQSSLQCTFKPSISKKSCEIAGHLKPSFQRLTMPIRGSQQKMPYKHNIKQSNKKYSKERIERLSKPRIMKTEPSENIEYRKIETQKKYTVPRSSNFLDVAARNQLWEEQKMLKLEKLRKQEEQIKLKKEKSTFVPRLTEYKGQKLANLSNFGKQGMANYFQRLHMAKSKNLTSNNQGKQNNLSYRRQNSPYASNTPSRAAKKQSKIVDNKKNQKVKYEQAVKQLHKKLMSLDI